MTGVMQPKCCKGVGKLLHLMKWLCSEIMNCVHELSRFMTTGLSLAHKKVMDTVMKYNIGMPECGLALKPNAVWDRTKDFKFVLQVDWNQITWNTLIQGRVSHGTHHSLWSSA